MGIDRWTYLGPYAEFKLPLKSFKRDTCRQPDTCPNAQSGQFCPSCGMEIKKRFHIYQITDPHLPEIVADVLGESLMTADGMEGPEQPDSTTVIYRLVPNTTREGEPREFHLDSQNAFWMEMSELSPGDEINWFKEAFAPEWEALREVFGEFEFKWGLMQWFH